MLKLVVTGLFIYPVKSMRGIAVSEAQLTTKGLCNDRRWMVIRSNSRFVTQREMPNLARVHTRLTDKGVVLSMQDHGSITIPTDGVNGDPIESKVWHDAVETIDQGEEISRWLTRSLGSESPLRLVAMKPGFTRPLHKADLIGRDTTTHFADAAPFLVANQASLEKLNAELEANQLCAVPMDRFRPNIVVKGLEPFAEHKVTEIASDIYQLGFRYPCERCVVTTINQETGEKDPHWQPYKTLATINPIPGKDKAPAFAVNAVLTNGDRERIATGDEIRATFR